MSEQEKLKGKKERIKEELTEEGTRDFLTGKSEKDILSEIEAKGEPVGLNSEEIWNKIRQDTGDIYMKKEQDTASSNVANLKTQQIYDDAIERLAKGDDPENVLLETDDKLLKAGLDEKKRDQVIDKIFNFSQLPEEEKPDEVLLKETGDTIRLPQLDTGLDDIDPVKIPKNKTDILPSKEKPLFTEQDRILSKELDQDTSSGPLSAMENLLNKKDSLIVETRKLSDFIKQVRVCVMTVPLYIRKLDIETLLYKYLSAENQGRFRRIFIFGWEEQRNTEDYKSFNQLIEINQAVENSLMIIRDVKTFNIFAADVLKGVSRNYFIIFLDGLVTREDLSVIENVTSGPALIYPEFVDVKVNLDRNIDVSVITESSHTDYYRNELAKYYIKPEVGIKEIYSDMSDQKNVINIGRKILNIDLQNLKNGLAVPGVSLNECLKRSPKFRNLITRVLSNSDSRILVKMIPGIFGLESFSFMYSLLKKKPIKPVFIYGTETFQSKRIKIESIPETGPCLVVTDFILVDTLIPKNIEKFYIVGGGEHTDMETLIDIMKVSNYTRDKYPRNLEIMNFLATLNNDETKTIDYIDYDKFQDTITKVLSNMNYLKDNSLPVKIEGKTLTVRMDA